MTRSVKRSPTESKEDILARHEFRRKRAEERARADAWSKVVDKLIEDKETTNDEDLNL